MKLQRKAHLQQFETKFMHQNLIESSFRGNMIMEILNLNETDNCLPKTKTTVGFFSAGLPFASYNK